MPSDRPFIKVDHGFPEHRKTVELSDRAFRQLIETWCMCARAENDGRLTDAQVSKVFSRKVRDELVAVGYLDKCESGWQMHDYLDHQTSAAHIADLRRKRAEAGSRGGKAKANRLALASPLAKQTASKSVPEVEVEEEVKELLTTKALTRANPIDAEFDSFWQAYPRRTGKDAARRAFTNARKRAKFDDIIAGAVRFCADPNREDAFTPHPATWLNAGRWADETPTPARNGHPKPSTINGNRPGIPGVGMAIQL